jgi:transposase
VEDVRRRVPVAWENLEEDVLSEFCGLAEISRAAWVREMVARGDIAISRVGHRTDKSESCFSDLLRHRVARRAIARGTASEHQREMVERANARVRGWQRALTAAACGPDRPLRGKPRKWTPEQIAAARSELTTKELALYLRCPYNLAHSLRAKLARGLDCQPRKPGPKPTGAPKGFCLTAQGTFQAYIYLQKLRVTLGTYSTAERAEHVAREARRYRDEDKTAPSADSIRAHVGFEARTYRAR